MNLSPLVWVPCFLLAVGALSASIGCSRPADNSSALPSVSAAALSSSSPSAETPRVVHVDPDLVRDGRVVVSAVNQAPVSAQLQASGAVSPAPESEAEVGALVSGRIASVLAKEGQVVKKGEVLAWLDAPEAARMRGDFLRARARLSQAERQAERERQLWSDKATSAKALADAEADLRVARADEAASRGLLASSHVPIPKDDAQNAAARIGIISPIHGVIVDHRAVVGAYVSPSTTVFRVLNMEHIHIRVDVPEESARYVTVGDLVKVTPRGTTKSCKGLVDARMETIEEEKRTMPVLAHLEEACEGLVAGGFADVTISLRQAKAVPVISVPRDAVMELDGRTCVFVRETADDSGKFSVRPVVVGRSDGQRVEIQTGLRPGEFVVEGGAFLLKSEYVKSAGGQ